MANQIAKKQSVADVAAVLETMKPQLMSVLPKHITPERMVRVALVALQRTPKLLECSRNSLFMAILSAAQLGLEPDGVLGQAYLIPYGSDVQFIPGYKGLIDLARRSGEVSNIIAKEVCENDEFVVDFSQEIPFRHKPKLTGERGNVTHFWAMARFKDGGFHWDYMSLDEVLSIRNQSSGYQAAVRWSKNPKNTKTAGQVLSPWEQHFIEMGKKTMIRRIAKYLPMSVQRAAAYDELQDAGQKVSFEGGELVLDEGITIDNDDNATPDNSAGNALDSFAGGNDLPPAPPQSIDDVQAATDAAIAKAQAAEAQAEATALKAPAELQEMPEKTARDLELKAREAIKLIEAGDDKASILQMINAPALTKKLRDMGRGIVADKLLNS